MSDSPYASPEAPANSSLPLRVERARHWLVVIAMLMMGIFLWDLTQAVLAGIDSELLPSLIRLVVGLGLTFAIWRGHGWARFVLAGLCVIVLCVNLPAIIHFPQMIERRNFVDAATVALSAAGYSAIALIALFNARFAGLASYRQEVRDMEQ